MMPTAFSFMTATEILFGRGQAEQAVTKIAALGPRVLLVHGRDASRADWLSDALDDAGTAVARFAVLRRNT